MTKYKVLAISPRDAFHHHNHILRGAVVYSDNMHHTGGGYYYGHATITECDFSPFRYEPTVYFLSIKLRRLEG